MIADLDETIRQLLMAELPYKNGEVDISFHQPKREWSARISRPTINLFLYDVRENLTLRQQIWDQQFQNQKGNGKISQKRLPHRVDCYYMLTTWAPEPEDEHRLLTELLLALFRHAVIPEHRLVGSLRNPQYEIAARVAGPDRLTNPAEVWSSLDNEIRPTIPYIVTITLDPWAEVEGPTVRTFRFRFGQAPGLPLDRTIIPEEYRSEMIFIGGIVRDNLQKMQPQAGLTVAVKDTGLSDVTDAQGRFTLGSLPPGDYTLVVWPKEGKAQEKKISVPATKGNYDMEIG